MLWPFDPGDLESERDDERGVDGRGDERLEPGDQFLRRLARIPATSCLWPSPSPMTAAESVSDRRRPTRRRPGAASPPE